MKTLPIAPRAGERISATLIREIIRAIGERTPIAGRGVRLSKGPYGTVINASPTSMRTEEEDRGCFYIKETNKKSDSTYDITFGNPYVRFGGKTYVSEVTGNTFSVPCIVYVKARIGGTKPFFEIKSCETMYELVAEEDIDRNYIFPLYRFGKGCEIKCDFRNAPSAGMWEFTEHTLAEYDDGGDE